MGPAVIPNLETHAVDLCDFFPVEEVFGVVHPSMRYKECRPESQFLEQRCHQCSVRLDCVIKGQDHDPFGVGAIFAPTTPGWSLYHQEYKQQENPA